ncbi:MAG: hypothetical protein K2I90_04275 [Odoribacter sp.]|nr:hypothetical protein [Odoribacter sp.]
MKKYVILLCLGVCCLWGCKQEGELDSTIALDNLFAIKDVPNDPVKHRVYEIFEKYEVPVYFNDTIGKYLLKMDVSGQPVYRYEVLDPAWSWSSYSSTKFSYGYLTDADEQMKALDVVEEYLETNQRAMYPFCFFIADSIMRTTVSNNIPEIKVTKNGFSIHFRTILYAPIEDASPQEVVTQMKRSMVKDKIQQYTTDLKYFNEVSDKNWYWKSWNEELHAEIPSGLDMRRLNPDFVSKWDDEYPLTEEELEELRVLMRPYCGAFGFVMPDPQTGSQSPADQETDLECYVKVMLVTSDKDFREQWGSCPLVMQKYEILYKIIKEKLGVEL